MENLEFRELEFKYKADSVTFDQFNQAMDNFDNTYQKIEVGSWDIYYSNGSETFLRLRKGNNPELTLKTKEGKNNINRREINIKLNGEQENGITNFARDLGYAHNFTINKYCAIYNYNLFNTVYYSVYDTNMQEIGRYIEIEFREEEIENIGIEGAMEIMREVEKLVLEPLGITYRNRLNKSLFEIYKRDM